MPLPVPTTEYLTRRLAECPEAFVLEPRIGRRGVVRVAAVVGDLLLSLGGTYDADVLQPFVGQRSDQQNYLRLVLIAAWLLHDPWFRGQAKPKLVLRWLTGADFRALASLVAADMFTSDADRREEIARLAMQVSKVLPAGENEAQAHDRLKTLNSVERSRVIEAAKAKRERARQLREEMERERAQEAAARYTRE